jgi:hypothetical protein
MRAEVFPQAAGPVAFGSHRKPEAILIPYEAYERYKTLARQRARLDDALSAAQSVQVELPGDKRCRVAPQGRSPVPVAVDA